MSLGSRHALNAVNARFIFQRTVNICSAHSEVDFLISTNDALRGSAKNIGALLNLKNCYFVPFRQDDPENKPSSLVADFGCLPDALEAAMKGTQLQPVIV